MVNTNLGQRISMGTNEGLEKRQRSQPSGKSPRRAGMSGLTAKVKTRAKSQHHKNPDGRFRGTYGIGPHLIEQEGDVLPPRTRLQHQGDSERLQQRRHGAILRVTWLTEEGPPRKPARPRHRRPEPEGD